MRISESWAEIRRGENVDLYLALTLSASFFILGLFGVASGQATVALSLLVLSLISYSFLGFKARTKELQTLIQNRSNRLGAEHFFTESYQIEEISLRIRSSEHVVLWGTTLSAHIPFLLTEVRNALSRNAHVQVLLIERTGAAIEMAAFRSQQDSISVLQRHLDNALANLEEIANQARGGTLEVRLVDYLAPYVAYFFNPKLQDGQSMIRLASFGGQARRPTMSIAKRTDPPWYDYFYSDFQQVWTAAAKNKGSVIL